MSRAKKKTLIILLIAIIIISVAVSPLLLHIKNTSANYGTLGKTETAFTLNDKKHINVDAKKYLSKDKISGKVLKVTNLQTLTGFKKNTDKIQEAINKLYDNGGGTVVLPKGEFGILSLEIKSNVNIYIPSSCTLNCVTPDEYESYTCNHKGIIHAKKANNFKIYGGGTIKAQGDYWFEDINTKDIKYTLKTFNMYAMVTQSSSMLLEPLSKNAPSIFTFDGCENFEIRGLNLKSSPSNSINLIRCKEVKITNTVIDNCIFHKGIDGISINEGRDILIDNCFISSSNSGIMIQSEAYKVVNVNISNCDICSAGKCFEIGDKTNHNIQNINLKNLYCFIPDGINTGLCAMAITSADGSKISNISVNDITIDGYSSPLILRLTDRLSLKKREIGSIHDISVKNINCTNCELPCVIIGDKNKEIYNVDIEGINMTYAQSEQKLKSREIEADNKDTDILAIFHTKSFIYGFDEYYVLPAYGIYQKNTRDISISKENIIPRENNKFES